ACYALRLAEACRIARDLGFTHISTTLAVSPYQLFETCGDVLAKTAAAYGLTPVWRDFRPFYPEATRTSRDLGMYRQNYCGCRFSAAEAAVERHEARDRRKAEREAAHAAANAAAAAR
ncbi:epoxyqueuosine reductase QueH, partial [Tractidigestivibacter sp.]